MVGHAALDRVIGVRIPASQPLLSPFSREGHPFVNKSEKHQWLLIFPVIRQQFRLGNADFSPYSSGSERVSEQIGAVRRSSQPE